MIELILDGHRINNRDELYEVIGQQLPLPDYFGNNLDALHDILTENTDPLCVTIEHFEQLRQHLSGRYLLSLLTMIIDCGCEIRILS